MDECLWDTALDNGTIAIVFFATNYSSLPPEMHQITTAIGNIGTKLNHFLFEHLFDAGCEYFDSPTVLGRHCHKIVGQSECFRHAGDFALVDTGQFIDFVEYRQHWCIPDLELFQRFVDGLGLLFRIGMGDVEYMLNQISISNFFECGAERHYEFCREFLNETDGIGE